MTLEEKDGYLPSVRHRLPNRTTAVEKLLAEHDTPQFELAAIMTRMREEPGGAPEVAALADRLQHWFRHIRNHEASENQLVQEAFNTDLGGGD